MNKNHTPRPIDQLWQAHSCMKALAALIANHKQMDDVNGDDLALLLELVTNTVGLALETLDNECAGK
ncbi:hypothetical protein [uncultured Endozoicomonas sp.]|uniref:hypothetical protein n=1 Tax=uncultured Endozoicomonas sp. TaxID=432652 RepID=UPI002602B722|nr:hypothetical protein [uncultured Endozoicomonas sp.]